VTEEFHNIAVKQRVQKRTARRWTQVMMYITFYDVICEGFMMMGVMLMLF
jgi:hypothetical protein